MVKHPKRRVSWTHGELTAIAEAWLDIAGKQPGLLPLAIFTEAQKVALPPDRHHPKFWYYNAKNKRVVEEALAAERRHRRANLADKTPAPSESAPKADAVHPLTATPHSDGGLGALLALAERLGEAFGRGVGKGLATMGAPRQEDPAPVPAGSDPALARANAREREALASGAGTQRRALPRVLLVGGRKNTLAELGDYAGRIDLRHVSMEESPSVVDLRSRLVDHAVVWAKAVGHKHQDALFSAIERGRITIVPPEKGLDAVRAVLDTLSKQYLTQ